MMRAVILACALASGALAQRIVYTKSFPGSVPAYVSITIERAGRVVYKESPADEYPVRFQLEPEAANEIFDLAQKLERFTRPLESGLKVANMGIKTFRWENGAEKSEVKFNFSQDEDAKLLQDWFERITETERHLFELERTVKYDKLGVHKALLQIHIAWDKKRLVAPEQFLPLLDRVIKNDSYLHMARERAAQLAEAFRGGKSKAE